MALREKFIKFMTEYGQEQADANATGNYKRPFSNLVRHDIVDCLKEQVDNSIYLVDGSVGKGRWAKVPWIAVFDTRITNSAQRGVYIVYLLNKDSKELFLTLNQGATTVAQGGAEKLEFTGMAGSFSKKAADDLKRKAESIRNEIGNGNDLSVGEINTGSTAYDSGCIFYKKYTVDDMPDDDVLFSDLSLFLASYKDYYNLFSQDEAWWPSAEEYNPGLTKEQWVEFINNSEIMNPKRLKALAQMYSFGGRATMRELEEAFGRSSDYYRNILSSISERAVEYFDIEACNQKNAKTWPCMFVGKSANKDRLGNYEWKMRDELKEALEEVNIIQYLDDSEENGIVFSLPDIFSDQLSKRFVNSLLAKPFVILTGNSGTGKTRIATRFAKYLEVQFDGGKNYELISVGADWTDNTAMLGYFNPLGNNGDGEYCETAILRMFIRAKENPEYPFFLILDEMNLSHVERYFSDFLSHMETPDTPFMIEHFSSNELTYPDNLFVIGTVNIDETTYMFSPKVLDRANVIEFKPDKNSVFALFDQQVFEETINSADENTARAFMSLVRKIRKNYSMDMSWAKDAFGQVYDILEENGFEFAYRTVKEICRYIYASRELLDSSFSMNAAVDEQVVQKLLPKIYGNKRSIGDMLEKLIKVVETDYSFELSAGKLRQMQKKLENTQYVSFI